MRKQFGVKGKLTIIFALMCLLVSLGLARAVYTISRSQVIHQYYAVARSSALAAAAWIDGDELDRFLDGAAEGRVADMRSDPSYLATYRRLAGIKTAFGLTYLYVVRPLDHNQIVYVFDIATDGNDVDHIGELGDLIAELGDEFSEFDVYDVIMAAYTSGEISAEPIITNTNFGWLASAYVPVYETDGTITAIVGADVAMDQVFADVRLRTFQFAGITAASILACLAVLLLLTDRRVLNPIVRLSRHMSTFSSDEGVLEDFEVTTTGDELQTIGESYNGLLENLRAYATNLAEVAGERERIATELGIANQIQAAMLPPVTEFQPPLGSAAANVECDLFASMTPAKEVGGDFYDFFNVDDHTLAIVIADVSGKGVPAALFMVIAKTLIKVTAQSGKTPAEVLYAVNNLLCEHNEAGMFVTAFIAYVDTEARTLTFANAGHNPPLIRSGDGTWQSLDAKPGFILAGMEDFEFPQTVIPLAEDAAILLYTDGVTEATNTSLELYSEPRLVERVNVYQTASGDELGPEGLIEFLATDIAAYSTGCEQADDITMLALTVKEPAPLAVSPGPTTRDEAEVRAVEAREAPEPSTLVTTLELEAANA